MVCLRAGPTAMNFNDYYDHVVWIAPASLAAVGLKIQSNRILTCLIAEQVFKTFGLQVIKEFKPVVVVPGLMRLKPFVQFFLGESDFRRHEVSSANDFTQNLHHL